MSCLLNMVYTETTKKKEILLKSLGNQVVIIKFVVGEPSLFLGARHRAKNNSQILSCLWVYEDRSVVL